MKLNYAIPTFFGCAFIIAGVALKYGGHETLITVGCAILLITAVIAMENLKS